MYGSRVTGHSLPPTTEDISRPGKRGRGASEGAAPKKPRAPKGPKKPKKPSPLAAFRTQTLAKKKALQAEKKRIDKELNLIIRDLGKLKRPPKGA